MTLPAALLALASLAATPSDAAMDQYNIIDDMTFGFGITPDVSWLPCGMENAWYSPGDGSITICIETLAMDAAVFVAAHETGHALVYGLGLKRPSYKYADERAADELAAVFLIEQGKVDQVVEGAKWFMAMPWRKADPHDPHPPAQERARELLCLADGAEGGSIECRALWAKTQAYWAAELSEHL